MTDEEARKLAWQRRVANIKPQDKRVLVVWDKPHANALTIPYHATKYRR